MRKPIRFEKNDFDFGSNSYANAKRGKITVYLDRERRDGDLFYGDGYRIGAVMWSSLDNAICKINRKIEELFNAISEEEHDKL
jgi:hypothetical protein